MNNFVTGLVRRGTGLPLPVAIRPAAGPRKMSISPESSEAVPAMLPAEAPTVSESRQHAIDLCPSLLSAESRRNTAEQEAVQIRIAAPDLSARSASTEQTAGNLRPRDLPFTGQGLNQAFPEMDTGDLVLGRRLVVPPQANGFQETVSHEVHLMPRNNDGQTHPVAPAVVLQESLPSAAKPSRPTRESGAGAQVWPHKHEQQTRQGDTEIELPASRIVPRQEPGSIAVPAQQGSAIASRPEKATAEPCSIQVKIGRVEIRSVQPATPVRVPRKHNAGGFADLGLARTYLDRSRG